MQFKNILFSLALGLLSSSATAGEPVRIFYIGNSVTDTIQYGKLAEMAQTRGVEIKWARHMIPGAPLFTLWRDDTGFKSEEYGRCNRALAEFPWDVVTVQPFDRHLLHEETGQGDITVIQKMLDAQLKQNPQVQFYIYSRWPRVRGTDNKSIAYNANDYDPNTPGKNPGLENAQEWDVLWNRKYTGGWDGTEETRDYFQQLLSKMREANPNMAKPILLIPVGDVFYALEKKMKAGKVPEFTSIWQLYRDGIHMNQYGSYLTALTFFATIGRQSPLGLPSTEYGDISPEVARIFQDTVWEVVSNDPLAGVKKP